MVGRPAAGFATSSAHVDDADGPAEPALPVPTRPDQSGVRIGEPQQWLPGPAHVLTGQRWRRATRRPDDGVVIGILVVAGLERQSDRLTGRLHVDDERALSPIGLAVEVQSTLTGEEQTPRSRPRPTRIRWVDDDAAHEVATRPFALIDIGQQLGHADEPKMSAATVSAAAASRLGATWL